MYRTFYNRVIITRQYNYLHLRLCLLLYSQNTEEPLWILLASGFSSICPTINQSFFKLHLSRASLICWRLWKPCVNASKWLFFPWHYFFLSKLTSPRLCFTNQILGLSSGIQNKSWSQPVRGPVSAECCQILFLNFRWGELWDFSRGFANFLRNVSVCQW